ncbi:hypothetical protein G7Z17_g7347 [Cylindrodendrum hubeiense]|uniref:Methyltransferase n=1 Tax=Cylindrodendrum hubeiense TaxID=595255 RepID=A0A9P5LFV3_9HYPO|nr:hypothetical protein G7Z17_g7347 [Cylindrodendrum hubeiense]
MTDQEPSGKKSPSSGKSSPRTVASSQNGDIPALEPDTVELSDDDSAIDAASTASSTTSLASSIAKYRMENGRTYHAYKEGSYHLPNDEIENERLAGVDTPLKRVLDAGCGTGAWAMDLADEHPETEVIGVDLSPIQPTLVPPNATFLVDDVEAEWTYSEPMDLIYLRFLVGSISDWDKLLGQAFQNLSPGGWVETADAVYPLACDDGTVTEDQAVYKWGNLMRDGAAKFPGRSLDTSMELKQKMLDQGFTNVTEKWYKWPMNGWPRDPKFKDIGGWVLENVLSGLSGLSMALFTRLLGWTREEVELFLIDVRKDMRNRNIHGYWRILVVSGQKPE